MKITLSLALSILGATTFATAIRQREVEDCCITKAEADDIVARWTSLAIKINTTVLDETVTNDIQFFSDSQNFLQGDPVRDYYLLIPRPLKLTSRIVWLCDRHTIYKRETGSPQPTDCRSSSWNLRDPRIL